MYLHEINRFSANIESVHMQQQFKCYAHVQWAHIGAMILICVGQPIQQALTQRLPFLWRSPTRGCRQQLIRMQVSAGHDASGW